jgi:hypothetical protein
VRAWCGQQGIAAGAMCELERLWKLASMWYRDRLDANWRRKTIAERQAILDAVGLHGSFWQLTGEI